MAAAVVAGAAFAGQEAIHLEHPRVWYAFDNTNNVQTSSGAANLTFTNAGATFEKVSDDDWAIKSVSGQCPYGTGFPCGDGSWTIVMRAKTVADANRIVLGTQSITAGNHGLVMYTAGGDKVRFSVIENFVNFEATLEISVTDAATAYHDYAISLDAADRRVHVSVDGVDRGSIPHPHYNKSNTSFQFFSMNGGPGDSGLSNGEGCAIADYRVYQRILTAAELSALHAGRTPVPVHGGFLPGSDVTVWKNTQLKDIVRVRARTGGSSIGKEWAVPFYATHTPEVYDVQMQYIQDTRYNKVMWAHFAQDGDDVKAKMNKVGYLEPNSYGNYGVKGTVANDFSINWVNNNTTAIGNQTAGYGLYQLTADTLYDEGAAVWTAGAGDFSTAANWKDGRAAEAGRNVSFVTGSGTVRNDLAAGTAFGRLAFGVESGSWTLAGNAATFAEVVNASTNAQTIAFPMAYAGDFKPETLGTLTFTNLTVGGTFQPVGVGEVEFSGETALETADVRYNVRTWDNPARYPKTSTGWAASKGYGTNNKKQIHLLRTLPGGHTEIGYLQTALTAQRIHATILDGDFTVRDAVALGSDALFVVTNGTTTLLSPLAPTSTLGVNAYAIVHAGAALKTPAFNAGTGMFLLVDGVADCDTASATGVMRIRWNGTLNTDLISGTGSVELDGATIGPLEGPLAITMPVTCVAGSSLVTGVVFRTSAKDGSASVVSQTAALTQNAAVPVSVIGGGRYEYAVGGAFTGIAPFTVGAGTLEVNGAGFAAPETVTVKSGVLKLGDGATMDSVGNKDTRIVVKDGATIDLNTKLSASNDKGRGAVLQNTIVEISGTGFEGRGAITDESGEYADIWQNQLGRVVVSSNATIAGTSRIDLRKPDNATYEGNTSLTGGDDVTLTIATHVPEAANCGLNFNNSDVSIGKIKLAEGGMVGFEAATTLNVPHGIEMKSNSRIHYWASSGTKAAITVTGTGAGLKASSNDENIQDKPVTVQEGASLDLRGDKALTYSAAFTNEGAVTVSGGTHKITGTELAGEGTFAVSAGDLQFNPAAASGALNLSVSGGSAHVGAAADWSSVPMTLAMTGGTFWWGMGEAAGFPNAANVDASGITSGLIDFHSGAASATVPAQFASANPNDIKFYNSDDNQTITIPAGNWTVKSRIGVANGSYPGHLVFGNGANVSANNLALAIDSSAPKTAIVEIGPGSTLTLSDYARIGEYSGASEYWHEVIVNGGTFNCANVFAVAYDSPLCYATLSSGRMSVGGLNVRSRWGSYVYPNSDERFTMTGGELDLGASGLTTARMKYNNTHANLQGGLYKATANHSVGYYGMLVATGEDMDAPGELTIDLNGKTVTHKNTPHFGSSEVTLTGGGSYVTSSDLQGIVNGKWTVDTAANATVNLTGFAGFAGGLELKDGTSASLGISGENAVEYHCLRGGNFATGYAYASTNGQFNSVVSHLKRFTVYTTGNSGPANSCAFLARGQFYVPEDDAGTWTFAGAYDDNIGLWVDGTLVISNTYQNVVCKQAEMTAGWHDFILVTRDGTGGQGPTPSGWQNNMCLGWKKGVSTSKTAADYNIFDTSTLRMRVKKPITSDGVTVERVAGNYSNLDTLRARTNWSPLWVTNSLQKVLNTKIAQQQTSSVRFTGGFLVEESDAGEWKLYGSWDDRIIVKFDGVEVLNNTAYNVLATSTVKMTPGWHSYEIRVGDGTGGYGPDAANLNSGYGLAVMRPGDTAKQPFDERTFTLTTKALVAQLAERPGLGGVTTVGAGATLTNGSPWSGANLNGRFCPIYGTLKGSGTLAGPYRFTGDDNCWEVTDATANKDTLPCVNFSDATPATFAGLKTLSVTFDKRPSRRTYYLTGAITGLTDADLPAATITVKDADDNDYSANFTFTVQNGRLALSNSRPAGTYIIVR